MRKNKVKKILLISLISLLTIGTLGASLAFFGKSDFNWVKNKVDNGFVKEEITRKSANLLKNSNFAINSSEKSVFDKSNVALNKATVDNWNFYSNDMENLNFTMCQVEDGLYVKNSGNVSLFLSQALSGDKTLYLDRDITLSLSVNGVVYSVSKYFAESSVVTLDATSLVGSSVKLVVESGTCNVSIFVHGGFEGVINWVQFEEGNVFTGYVPPVIAD